MEKCKHLAKHKNDYILKTVRDRAISAKILTLGASLLSNELEFQKLFVYPKMAAILNFRIFCKNCKMQKGLYLKNHESDFDEIFDPQGIPAE